MSILTIAQNVATEAHFNAPSTIVGNVDPTSQLLLLLIKRATTDISNSFRWSGLVKQGTFNFVNNQTNYTLASDYKEYIPMTMWDYTTRRPIIAPIDAEDYGIQTNYLITSGIDKMAYFYGNQVYITPVPSNTDTINYSYKTNNIFKSSGGSGQTTIIADTDTTIVPEYLVELSTKLRYLVSKGLITPELYQASYEKLDFEEQLQAAQKADGMGQKGTINMNTGGNAYWKAAYTQDSNFPQTS
jgi:hypothetical protein